MSIHPKVLEMRDKVLEAYKFRAEHEEAFAEVPKAVYVGQEEWAYFLSQQRGDWDSIGLQLAPNSPFSDFTLCGFPVYQLRTMRHFRVI